MPAGKGAASTKSLISKAWSLTGPGCHLDWTLILTTDWLLTLWSEDGAGPSSGHELTLDSGHIPSLDPVVFLSFQTQCKVSRARWLAEGNHRVPYSMNCIHHLGRVRALFQDPNPWPRNPNAVFPLENQPVTSQIFPSLWTSLPQGEIMRTASWLLGCSVSLSMSINCRPRVWRAGWHWFCPCPRICIKM